MIDVGVEREEQVADKDSLALVGQKMPALSTLSTLQLVTRSSH